MTRGLMVLALAVLIGGCENTPREGISTTPDVAAIKAKLEITSNDGYHFTPEIWVDEDGKLLRFGLPEMAGCSVPCLKSGETVAQCMETRVCTPKRDGFKASLSTGRKVSWGDGDNSCCEQSSELLFAATAAASPIEAEALVAIMKGLLTGLIATDAPIQSIRSVGKCVYETNAKTYVRYEVRADNQLFAVDAKEFDVSGLSRGEPLNDVVAAQLRQRPGEDRPVIYTIHTNWLKGWDIYVLKS